MKLTEQIEAMRAKVNKHWSPKSKQIERIQAAAIAVFDVEEESFFNGERTRSVAYARMASMVVSRARTGLPNRTIGKLHGGLDPSSVSYAHRIANDDMHGDLKNGIAEIERLTA